MAVVLNAQVIVPDVASDTRWESDGFPALALACGIKSCWPAPIRSSTGELLGSFAITNREAGSPTLFHQALIEQLTHIASIAIERTRSEADLACDVTALGSVYLGGFTWAQLARALRVEEVRAGAVARADALFNTAQAPWCPEIF